ncbi:sugar phosphate isomerase/epimerase family protein [Paenarthrobacter nitroguajacolicus]|uniref:sugar phosphate isomerase/epimerase family protein n=1 Tax=Paenarthrobacter nitroguajacolicus TaxID=211146 RepID=UPI00248C21C3|nr:sugar phosphate isomerase/epimerase [Paenarthrobacter nitroguajacolicus]MDI2035619.1 hypothetical protein [Paenarthrobacter nitroguajacolicus]
MTYPSTPEFTATCWTSAGDAAPLREPETSPVPIVERLDAIAATGWSGLGLVYDDLLAARDTIGFGGLRKLIDDAGFRHVEVELLNNWWDESRAHQWRPRWEVLLDAAEELGAGFVKIGTSFGEEAEDYDAFAGPLRELTKEAVSRGTKIALEPVAFTLIRSIPAAADLMRLVDMPDCGLIIDYWHIFRNGTSLDDVARKLTAEQIFGVELNDADATVRGTLFEDTRDNRRYCGEGDQDVTGFIRTLQGLGFQGPWGVEMLSNEHRALPLREALEKARSTALSCFPA